MTLTYSLSVSTANLYNFHRLLLRWRASVWQAVWQELCIWLGLYTAISLTYRYWIVDSVYKSTFEDAFKYCEKYSAGVPITFVLGFYVSLVVTRWWNIYMSIPWPDNCALAITSLTRSKEEEKGRLFRRTMVRYLMLAEVMVFRDVSSSIKKRFPTFGHVKLAGLITEQELKQLEAFNSVHPKYWIPLQWTCTLLKRARDTGFLTELSQLRIVKLILRFRGDLGNLYSYDWISVPLVYTQVVNIAVRSFFVMCLFGRQYIKPTPVTIGQTPSKSAHLEADLYVPLFTILQFIFFIGWLKVAEALINPLGEDDDDFEVNYIIDRNFQVAYDMVDENYDKLPPLEEDIHWNTTEPPILLHTIASANLRNNRHMMGSCVDVSVAPEEAKIAPMPEMSHNTSVADTESNGSATKRKKSFGQAFHSFRHRLTGRTSKFRSDSINLDPVIEDENSSLNADGAIEENDDEEKQSLNSTPQLLKKNSMHRLSRRWHNSRQASLDNGQRQQLRSPDSVNAPDLNAELFAVSVAPTTPVTITDSMAVPLLGGAETNGPAGGDGQMNNDIMVPPAPASPPSSADHR